MSEIYVYAWNEEDFTTIGECGALMPFSCIFEEVANGLSEITLKHPIDIWGKYRFLERDSILRVQVPVRTTPEIENGEYVTVVEKWKIKSTATKDERIVYSKATKGKKLKTLAVNKQVTVTSMPENGERWKIKTGKTSGWIASTGLESIVQTTIPGNAGGIEDAEPAWECRDQLFRIYSVNKRGDSITCNARHISYDLMYNMTTYNANGSVTLAQTANGLLNNCMDDHEFELFTDIKGTRVGAHYRDVDPITAFLDPETGVATAWNAQLVRDNYELYMLGKAGINRGMRIEYARNMQGVTMSENMDSVATYIRPVGEQKDGSPLYLTGTGLVASAIASQYPFKRIYKLDCTNCKVGTDGVTTAIARARMQEQANELLAQGIDKPSINIQVTFAQLGHTARYSQYKGLDSVFLFDEVAVYHPKLGIDVSLWVVRIMWDCIQDKMQGIELGNLRALMPSVASWQIPSGISGTKLIPNSVGSGQLGSDVVNTRHLQAESVNADAIQTNAIITRHMLAGSITAEKLEAETVKAMIIEAVQAKIGEIVAGKITSDELFTAILGAVKLSAETGTFTFAEVQNMLANTLFVVQGVGEKVQIANLSVTEANIVSLSVGDLLIRNENGEMVRLYVDGDGNVQTGDPIADGTLSGAKLIEGSITTAQLNAEEIFANNGTIMNLIAGRLTANEAFIDSIVTTAIGNLEGMLELYVRKDNLETYLRLLSDGVHVGQSSKSSEVVVTPETVDVRLNGATYSQFASNYVQFGNYQLRRSADGGLVFKLKE